MACRDRAADLIAVVCAMGGAGGDIIHVVEQRADLPTIIGA